MAHSRTTYQDRSGGAGATASGDTFVWVSLRDPSAEELASVEREFGLPGPLVEQLGVVAKRPALEVVGELLVAVVKTVRWEAAEEAVRVGEVQLVLGDGFVVSVDRDGAVLERVRQDLENDLELVGAGLAAVLPCVVDHAAESYGPVLDALYNAVEEVAEAVFSSAQSRPTERIYRLSRQVLEIRRAVAPLTEMLDRLAASSSTDAAERLKQRERRAHLLHLVELADAAGRHLRDELPAPARAGVGLWLPAGAGGDGTHLHRAVPGVPTQRLAVAGQWSAR
jgi:magnesium transporter